MGSRGKSLGNERVILDEIESSEIELPDFDSWIRPCRSDQLSMRTKNSIAGHCGMTDQRFRAAPVAAFLIRMGGVASEVIAE